ncbi:hypothetical protein KFK09_027022 [Dendrobium nobile]|uniref:GTD-binding domain-containing protein n=1 Tax=Dendrobium nobile TaxID=94219 RepID=A0A8T3A871_DENNO|nr:hypothetical protein KFK09_027022 [Dendrobium nobile]
MACRAVESWTLTSLVGAYLDLALAYLLLVGATIAFLASKLLSLAGLSLPCTCDGRFGHPSCAQNSLLLDFPRANLAAVHHTLRSRFPFDSLLPAGASPSPRCRYAVQYPSEDCDLPPPEMPPDSPEEPLVRPSPGYSIYDREKSYSTSAERISGGPWDFDEDVLVEEVADEEENDSCNGVGGLLGCDKVLSLEALRSLEQELEEERGAHAALYLELEKERNAAASAADEAMAMILRLQKEKAEIGMEARQYKRMVEEKSAYDEEEMEILKEIIVRREREKHVLENEVEMYKQMMNSGDRVELELDNENFLKDNLDTLVDSSDDPMLMLKQIYKSVGKKEEPNDFGVESSPITNSSIAGSNHGHLMYNFVGSSKHPELFSSTDDCDQEFQEKTILATCTNSSSSNILNTTFVDDSVVYSLNAPFEAEYHKDITDFTAKDEGERVTPIDTIVSVEGPCTMGSDETDQRCSESSQHETESNILDVQVQFEEDSNQNVIASEEELSCTNFDEMELKIRRSCSEITNRISLIDSLYGRTSCFNPRSSLPYVESERYKIENEVDVLRKRLEIIRQGRKNLSLYADQKEKETFQLQLLDEIAFQLEEIKKVTKPAKSLRRVSLPPLSSKFKGHINGEF